MVERGYVLRLTGDDAQQMMDEYLGDLELKPLPEGGHIEINLHESRASRGIEYFLTALVYGNPFLPHISFGSIVAEPHLVEKILQLFYSPKS